MTSFYEEDANCAAMTDHDLAAALEAQIPASGDVPPIATLTKHLLTALGEDPSREGLLKTPQRVENAWRFLSQGYREDLKLIVNNALFESANDDIVLVKDIVVFSMCEHHLLPFWGRCHIAYIPNGKVIGLSKLPRIADMFGRRLQLQERLTQQIADAVDEVLKPRGVAVITECRHMCMMMRGVEKNASSTVCRSLKGVFKTDDSLRRDLGRMVEESTAV